jgi:hypothetical protein
MSDGAILSGSANTAKPLLPAFFSPQSSAYIFPTAIDRFTGTKMRK